MCCLQYSVEVSKAHPLFAALVVNDVVAKGISWMHTLLYSSFYSFSKAGCAYHRKLMKGEKKDQPAGFIYGFSETLFFFGDQTQLWAFWPPVNLFHTL